MPPVYLCAIVHGETIRYLHSTPDTKEAAEDLARHLNRGLGICAYMALRDDD